MKLVAMMLFVPIYFVMLNTLIFYKKGKEKTVIPHSSKQVKNLSDDLLFVSDLTLHFILVWGLQLDMPVDT